MITADVLDDFDRPDENPLSQGGNWLNSPGSPCQVVSHDCASAGGDGIAGYVGIDPGTVQECWCEFGSWALAVNNSIRAAARMTITAVPDRFSAYQTLWAYNGISQQIQLRRTVNNADTVLAFIDPFNLTAGDRIAVRTDEDRIEGWVYTGGVWSMPLVATDSTIASGKVGLVITGVATRISAFGGGTPFSPQIVRTY